MMKWGRILCVGLLVGSLAQATEANECSGLKGELDSLKAAQSQLLRGMVRKNDSLADTLDSLAAGPLSRKRSAKRQLADSAEAYRAHSLREEKLVTRFEEATANLLEKVERCLTLKPVASLPESGPSRSR